MDMMLLKWCYLVQFPESPLWSRYLGDSVGAMCDSMDNKIRGVFIMSLFFIIAGLNRSWGFLMVVLLKKETIQEIGCGVC